MKKISKILAVVLCLAMAISMLAVGVSAATEKCVEYTVDSLGLQSQAYTAGTATVDGVAVEWIQLGNYGNGIQVRDSDKGTSMFWNTDAFPGGITKIELTYSDTKDVNYANPDAVIFNFGNAAKGADYTAKLSTVIGEKSYTITPDAETYTYFYMEHDWKNTFYWQSIKVYYNDNGAQPEQPEVITNYYIAGVPELCGSYWDPCDSGNMMTKGSDGLYTKTFENVAAGNYELKVTDGGWDNCWGANGDNYKFTLDALSNVTVLFNADSKTVSVEIEAVKVLAVGPISDALAGADGEEFMVQGVVTCIDGKNVYVQDATGGICVRAADYVEDLVVGDTVIGTGTKSVYRGLTQLSGSYEKSEGCELVINETTIDALTTADICTYIKLSGVEVTIVDDNDGTYSQPNITVTDGTNTIQIYKAVVDKNEDGTWAVAVGDKIDVMAAVSCYYETLQLRNTTADEIAVVDDEIEQPENPEDPEQPENPENPEDPEQPENPEQPAEPSPYYVAGEEGLCGSNWSQNDPANNMTLGEDGLYSIVYENVAAGTYQFKVTDGTWDNCWGDPENTEDMGNYVITVENAGDVTITFNAETKAITVKVGGEEIPKTGDMSVAALVVAVMAATAGVVVIGKKKEF